MQNLTDVIKSLEETKKRVEHGEITVATGKLSGAIFNLSCIRDKQEQVTHISNQFENDLTLKCLELIFNEQQAGDGMTMITIVETAIHLKQQMLEQLKGK